MPHPKDPQAAAVLPASPLVINESTEQFQSIHDALIQEIKPRGMIEQIYVKDIADLTWEILRIRRFKTAILDTQFSSAAEKVLKELLLQIGHDYTEAREAATDAAGKWFTDKETREWGQKVLQQFQLDESAIEARSYAEKTSNFEALDKLEASLMSRRDKSLRCIAEYRIGLAHELQETSDRIIEGKVLALEDKAPDSPPITGPINGD